ncbi:hypothetical protein [Pseudomonas benzenivorans]|uniref:Uncharacterized protein n=1 Tax=Pseudomonas benzenivorans TaxID=556533 RepID=A0ABY5H4E4_9PSED|nr:hypothetical protein [Pseudomonas benzenivorans]UTW07168.1 hypothetical protein KDW96_18675 [Pseudomonas benzenivorans]
MFVALCQVSIIAAAENGGDSSLIRKESVPVLGDPNYKLDSKYWPIHGSPRGKSFFLHYCLPGFVPQGLGGCRVDLPGRDPRGIQVEYLYSLGGRDEHAFLEGSPAFLFPFPVNINLEGKTPYLAQYKKSELSKWRSHQVVKDKGELSNKYDGLDFYEASALPGGWWVPENIFEYQTRLGNPPIFVCSDSYCALILDQGSGWVVRAKFNEAALSNWREFLLQLNVSIKEILGQ